MNGNNQQMHRLNSDIILHHAASSSRKQTNFLSIISAHFIAITHHLFLVLLAQYNTNTARSSRWQFLLNKSSGRCCHLLPISIFNGIIQWVVVIITLSLFHWWQSRRIVLGIRCPLIATVYYDIRDETYMRVWVTSWRNDKRETAWEVERGFGMDTTILLRTLRVNCYHSGHQSAHHNTLHQ